MSIKAVSLSILFAAVMSLGIAPTAAAVHPSYSENVEVDTMPFYENGRYDQSVPHPNEYLKHPLGQWPLRYHELTAYLKAVAERSPRVKLEVRGQSYEDRDMFNVFVSSAEDIANLEQHRLAMDKLADPDAIKSLSELVTAIETQRAFAWIGHNIHGDELSGTDAAVQLVYHLAAANDSATLHLLDNMIVIVDPLENPDGRERYVHMLQTNAGHVPNYDANALQHSGVWPWGRTNHYLFDLNRDCILVTQIETVSKLATMQKYNPILAVDAHEMGSNATYLFSPPREPINYNTPSNVLKWWNTFREDQAAAYDKRGWPYYSREWNEQWYPGYTSAWPTFFGAVGILYEQAGVDGTIVRQRDGYLLTFHEAVNHQFTSSITNLFTAADHRCELLKDFHDARMYIVVNGRRTGLQFLFVPDGDELKTKKFIESLINQGIEVQRATGEFIVGKATDIYHEEYQSHKFPAGTYIVSTAQPNGALAKAVLDFDPHLKLEFLQEERRELEKHGDTRMYEVSAWSTSLAYDMDAYLTTSKFNAATEPVTSVTLSSGQLINPEAQFGFVVDMEGDKTYRLLNRIFGHELTVFAAEKPFTVEGRSFKAGSLLLRKRGNPEELPTLLATLAEKESVSIYGINTGLATEGSDLGASTFHLLKQPRIALVTGDGINFSSVGTIWFTIDRELEVPHSLIPASRLSWTDLSEYNVLILPSAWGPSLRNMLGKQGAKMLDEWVSDGGTLVLTGNSATWAADSSNSLSDVRLTRQSLDKLDMYRRKMKRELAAEAPDVDTMDLWHPDQVVAVEEKKDDKPEDKKDDGPPKKNGGKEAEELDRWEQRFHPRGVIMRAVIDSEDWLAFGTRNGRVPVMVYSRHALLSAPPVKTVARFSPEENNLRLGGLLWPEARRRWVGSAYLTRESKGRGQIIMFATDPYTRAYFWGTRKMFVNAILYGPGFTSGFEPYGQ
ncbi:MAG: M14 family metallopeptidase [bacterium]